MTTSNDNLDGLGVSAGDLQIDTSWSEKDWARLAALASKVPAGSDRIEWVDAVKKREQEYVQVLMEQFDLDFPTKD